MRLLGLPDTESGWARSPTEIFWLENPIFFPNTRAPFHSLKGLPLPCKLRSLEADPKTELEVQDVYWDQCLQKEGEKSNSGQRQSWTEVRPDRVSSGADVGRHGVLCWAEAVTPSAPSSLCHSPSFAANASWQLAFTAVAAPEFMEGQLGSKAFLKGRSEWCISVSTAQFSGVSTETLITRERHTGGSRKTGGFWIRLSWFIAQNLPPPG